MNQYYKNVSVLRDKEATEFPEKREYDLAYKHLQQENDRLQHLTTVLIEHIWKKQPFPLKEIDEKMLEYDKELALFDDGGMDGTPRNA